MREPEEATGPAARRLALAVADVNWYTTEALFREADSASTSVLALRCMDYVNGWRRGMRPWSRCPLRRWGRHSFRRELVLPSGWMKRFPRVGMRPIARTIRTFWERSDPAARRALVLTYPHYVELLNRLEPGRSLYYNIDDYTLYWPRVAAEVVRLEREAVLRTDLTVCVAHARAEELRAALPAAAGRIHHVPHGTPEGFLTPEPCRLPGQAPDDIAHLPRPLLGYVGSVEGRVDWPLMRRLGEAFPDASLVIVGRPPLPGRRPPSWHDEWRALAERPNVHALGWRDQAELPAYYAAFDVSLIPYRIDDPFNRACSPTKIMDGMGSGRPIVATALPECRLYTDLFEVAEDHEAFLEAVASLIRRGSDDGRAGARHEFARAHSCGKVVERILRLIDA
jgi:glycosyltransferase involved in cell wall biosynthesis